MPQLFFNPSEMKQDFAFLANSTKNKAKYDFFIANGHQVVQNGLIVPVGCELHRVDHDTYFELGLISKSDKAVLYYCKVVRVEDESIGIDGVTQALVWRNRMKPQYKKATVEFVSEVFNHYLIENYTVLISDVYHSYGGMFMWQEQLGYAIERRDRRIMLYDQMNCVVTEIDRSTFDDFLDDLWSEDESKLHYRAVIKKL